MNAPMKLQIDEEYLLARLQRLLATASPSGFTDLIAHECAEELQRLGLRVEVTRRGAVRARPPAHHRRCTATATTGGTAREPRRSRPRRRDA